MVRTVVLTARRGVVWVGLSAQLYWSAHTLQPRSAPTRLDSTLYVFQQVHTKFRSRYLLLRIINKSSFCNTVHLLLPECLHLRTLLLNERKYIHNNFNGNRVHTVFPNQLITRKKGSCNETNCSILFLGYYKLTVDKEGEIVQSPTIDIYLLGIDGTKTRLRIKL